MNAATKRPDINGIRRKAIKQTEMFHEAHEHHRTARQTLDLLAYIDRLESSRGTEIAGLRAELAEARAEGSDG